MIDRRGFIGNDVIFWAKEYSGYTTDVDKAHIFGEDEAKNVESRRSTDCAIPLEEVQEAMRNAVDFQHLDRKYFDNTYCYFDKNNTVSSHEKEVAELRRKINALQGLYEDMENMQGDYNLTIEQLIAHARDSAAKIVKGEE
jgi:hypothetical protein